MILELTQQKLKKRDIARSVIFFVLFCFVLFFFFSLPYLILSVNLSFVLTL